MLTVSKMYIRLVIDRQKFPNPQLKTMSFLQMAKNRDNLIPPMILVINTHHVQRVKAVVTVAGQRRQIPRGHLLKGLFK